MPRPIMNINGSEYQEILKQRQMIKEYGADYPQMKHALDMLDKLEKKKSSGLLTYKDKNLFEDIKSTIHMIETKRKGETVDNHTTTHYIWHTVGDNRVRSRHSELNGKIFSWNNPPADGHHPGEDWGCRCWAEPAKEKPKILQEYVRQIVTSAPTDILPTWSILDYLTHYYDGNGTAVTLHEMGLLQTIIGKAKKDIFPFIEKKIFTKANRVGPSIFPFRWHDSYNFHSVDISTGGAVVTVTATGIEAKKIGEFWDIKGELTYDFSDEYTDPGDWLNRPGEDYNFPGSTPFKVTDTWKTHLDALIKRKDV